jgi:hypothetical protein
MPETSNEFNVWHHKPWWCQPWSILLTGATFIGGSWFAFHRLWLTALVAVPLGAWMGYFLLVFPRVMAQLYRDRDFN